MRLIVIGLCLLCISSFANAGEEEKLEGRCRGVAEDRSEVNFAYYSNYEGCAGTITGTIKFSTESGLGDHKGNRSFQNQQDIYSFKNGGISTQQEIYRLTFKDSTGNVSGVLDYFDSRGDSQSITVQCEIQDFEYGDCPAQI